MLNDQDNPQLSVIVISYNTRVMTLECLASVYAQTSSSIEVIIVDNASTDGSAEAIAQRFPQARLIAEKVNHGFAQAHNIAFPYVRSGWILLLNPDTVVLDHAIDKLLDFAHEVQDAKIWGGRTLFADHSLNVSSCWRRMSLWTVFCRVSGLTGIFPRSRIFNSEQYGGWMRNTVREVDIVTGCFFLLQRDTWAALGGLDTSFTMYGEDADLCIRARKELGARPHITPAATIIHHGGASETVATDRIIRVIRAKTELIKRHFSPGTRTISLILFSLFPLSRKVANSLAGRLLKREELTMESKIWAEVWERRNEWKYGFK